MNNEKAVSTYVNDWTHALSLLKAYTDMVEDYRKNKGRYDYVGGKAREAEINEASSEFDEALGESLGFKPINDGLSFKPPSMGDFTYHDFKRCKRSFLFYREMLSQDEAEKKMHNHKDYKRYCEYKKGIYKDYKRELDESAGYRKMRAEKHGEWHEEVFEDKKARKLFKEDSFRYVMGPSFPVNTRDTHKRLFRYIANNDDKIAELKKNRRNYLNAEMSGEQLSEELKKLGREKRMEIENNALKKTFFNQMKNPLTSQEDIKRLKSEHNEIRLGMIEDYAHLKYSSKSFRDAGTEADRNLNRLFSSVA